MIEIKKLNADEVQRFKEIRLNIDGCANASNGWF